MFRKDSNPMMAFAAAIVFLLASVGIVSWLLRTQDLGIAVRIALAAFPVIAWTLCILAEVRLIRQADELQQRIHLEALAIAFTSVAVAILACEYLRKAGVISALKPDYVLVMMMVFWVIGYLVARRRYQ